MTAYDIADEWQRRHSYIPLEERIEWHKRNGLIFITKKLFIIACESYYNQNEEDLEMNATNPNAWFIELAASSDRTIPLREIMAVLPNKQDFVLWCRRGINRLHTYNWDKLARKVGL